MDNQNEQEEQVSEQPAEQPAPTLTPEQLKQLRRQQLGSDFELGRSTQHLRLPNGLPK